MASKESARQRELYRYYSPWLEKYGKPASKTSPSASSTREQTPTSSLDRSLTAFAQLGALRLNAKRCIVTLIASTQQYVLAEATKSLSLMHDMTTGKDDELWFGNAVVQRSQGMSEHALNPESYAAKLADGTEHSAPAFIVNDLAADERFRSKGYAGRGINFYSGVPLKTKTGHAIGVYSVTDDKPRNGVTGEELVFLEDMAQVIVEHLEVIRYYSARHRGERLVRSLASFIEGRSTYASHSADEIVVDEAESRNESASGPNEDDSRPKKGANTRSFKGLTISDPSHGTRTPRETGTPESQTSLNLESGISNEKLSEEEHIPNEVKASRLQSGSSGSKNVSEYRKVFSRAASLLRRSMNVDGVMFFDASSANLSRTSVAEHGSSNRAASSQSTSGSAITSSDSGSDSSERRRDRSQISGVRGGEPRTSSSPTFRARGRKRCNVLGMSVNPQAVPASMDLSLEKLGIAEQDLKRCIRRYPNGKVFIFNDSGELSADDTDSPGTVSQASRSGASGMDMTTQSDDKKRKGEKLVARAFHSVVSNARNLVFLPLWDFSKRRWASGVFIWSTKAGLLLTVQDDLSYIKAFGYSIMNEISRLNVLDADKAKATFLANISHELRSPLHGILGSIEFLQDTAVNSFQSGLITSIETCGKTLLDTIDHVLDHAKINRLSRKSTGEVGLTFHSKSDDSSDQKDGLTDAFDLAVVVEEVVEAVYAGQTFRSTNAESPDTLGKFPSLIAEAESTRHSRPQLRHQVAKSSAKFAGNVALTVRIDHRNDWYVSSQPGAIRRVLTNILGNALKYTSAGYVNVDLRCVSENETAPASSLKTCLTVTDTGKGISEDFLKHHAFKPFQQEDSFSSGVGLGLSIVQQIVDSLHGTIELSSEKDQGTEVKVWLTLPKPQSRRSSNDVTEDVMQSVQSMTKGLAFCMLEPPGYKTAQVLPKTRPEVTSVAQSFRSLATSWYGMKVIESQSMEGVVTDFFVYAEPPPIEYLLHQHGESAKETEIPVILMCTNAFEAASLRANGIHHLTDIGRVIEIISQPCGPQKLAKALNRCFQRLERGRDSQIDTSSGGPISDIVCDNPNVYEQETDFNYAPTNVITAPNSPAWQEHDEQVPESDSHIQNEEESGESTTPHRPPSIRTISAKSIEFAPPTSPKQPLSVKTGQLRPPLDRGNSLFTSSESDFSRATDTRSNQSSTDGTATPMPRALVVDDNPINLQLLTTFMRKARLPYVSAVDGLEAFEAFKLSYEDPTQEPFKYVLMDISMPVMDGLESTREIRRYERSIGAERKPTLSEESSAPKVDESAEDADAEAEPEDDDTTEVAKRRRTRRCEKAVIIALTGLANETTMRDAHKSGMDYFLSKPVKFKDLKALIL